ncbi:MAG: glycosyltransferase [Wenzhouxiangellaceae bacterium]|nr:glycosyltransferase [Wenzhouxiangellaceae bacterium]
MSGLEQFVGEIALLAEVGYPEMAARLAPVGLGVAVSVIAVNGLQYLIYTVQLVLAGIALLRRPVITSSDSLQWLYSDVILPVSLIAPAYNEETTVVEAARSLLRLRYPLFEVVIVNDGSTDNTLQALDEEFELERVERAFNPRLEHAPVRQVYRSRRNPRLVVVDKINGGSKGDAMNAGIDIARMPLVASLDGDSLLEEDSLIRIVHPFVEDPDRVIAVGGTVRVVNDCVVRHGRIARVKMPRSWLARFQVLEYLRAFLIGRLGWDQLQSLTIISGAFGVFRRDAVIEAGGFYPRTLGEDFELVTRLHHHFRSKGKDYRIVFVPEPVCWTQVPERLGDLMGQRIRWQRGALETLFRHKSMLIDPRAGRVGFLGLGQIVVLDLLGPIAETLGYVLLPFFWIIGALDGAWFAAFLALIFAYSVFISLGSVILEELELKRFPRISDLLLLSTVALLENFGYRQINNLWRIAGTWQFLRGKRSSWGTIRRQSFSLPGKRKT